MAAPQHLLLSPFSCKAQACPDRLSQAHPLFDVIGLACPLVAPTLPPASPVQLQRFSPSSPILPTFALLFFMQATTWPLLHANSPCPYGNPPPPSTDGATYQFTRTS
ncbi:hypothetical protein GOP47_0026086 [Adiantum capillus-veneris]|uniref:Uncharacterized protein n=1 Tax=Adiantum capillus-veneris TaxID=13818 RepID=A0A9D4Z459_ADICA|nr:hypothetical protein GOP47_0026086 [Adiantum capillus-veneris]